MGADRQAPGELRPSAVLLDRDGIINEPVLNPDSGDWESPYRPAEVELIPATVDLIRSVASQSIPIAVVSNQPAAAKGTCSLADLQAVDAEVQRQLESHGAAISEWHYCFHHPAGSDPALTRSCSCRKPQSGLLVAALSNLEVPLTRSVWMIGDSDVDVEAGSSIGASTILVGHPKTSHRRLRSSCPTHSVGSTDAIGRLLGVDGRPPNQH